MRNARICTTCQNLKVVLTFAKMRRNVFWYVFNNAAVTVN